MLSWFQAIMPKEGRFYDLFEEHATTLCAGARSLRQMLDGGDEVRGDCAAVPPRENDADDPTRKVMLVLRQTVISACDRSGIIRLPSSMDDAIDEMHKTAKAVMVFDQRALQADMVS